MTEQIPIEIVEFLLSHGYDNRKIDQIKLNIIINFSNPKVLSDIISFQYPKLLPYNTISDASSSTLRLEQWNKLNKTLLILRCELTDEKINKFINKKITKDELYNYIRLLKVKLDSYEPQYLAKYMSSNSTKRSSMTTSTMQNSTSNIKQQQSIESIEESLLQSMSSPSRSSQSRQSIIFGSTVATPINKTPFNSTAKEDSIITTRGMSTDEMTNVFEKLSSKLKNDNEYKTKEIDLLQNKSNQLDHTLKSIRSQNLQDLTVTEKNINYINNEIESLKLDRRASMLKDPNNNTASARRATVTASKLGSI